MRISDWSSDVCSSDLCRPAGRGFTFFRHGRPPLALAPALGSQRCHKGAQKACYPDEQAANDELEERAMTAAVRSLSLKIRRCRGGLAGCLAVLLAGCPAPAGPPGREIGRAAGRGQGG